MDRQITPCKKVHIAISLVIPLKDEAASITLLIDEIFASLKKLYQYEVILVNDGSTDDTAKVINQLAQQNHNIFALHHQENYGQSRAIYSGVEQAKYDWIVSMDGDGQNDPVNILDLLATLEGQLKTMPGNKRLAILGYRYRRCDSLSKRISSKFANYIRHTLLKDKSRDSGCSLKLFSRREFLRLPYFDHFHRFLPALMLRQGVHLISIPVNHRARLNGHSKYGISNRLWVGIIDLIGVYWLLHRYKIANITTIEDQDHEHCK